jgi:16S rRNA (cytosine1402-N4)-methyltransferase
VTGLLMPGGEDFKLHVPVMRSESMGALTLKPGGVYVDGTFGAGGYTREILASFPDTRVIGYDRDPDAIREGQALVESAGGRLQLVEDDFIGMAELEAASVDGVVLDIGVSSMQFDRAERGFSFRTDSPLDMRMSQSGTSAADIVNSASAERLADIFYHYGEERFSRPLARAVVEAREIAPITTTRQLAEVAAKVIWAKPGEIHPATRAFQALRIAVNDELGQLAEALHAAERILKPGGMLVVVTFHSLEDRIVKQFFAARSGKGGGSRHQPLAASTSTFRLSGKWPCMAEPWEVAFNPRARSAKLRAGQRTADAAQAPDASIVALARLPDIIRPARSAKTVKKSPAKKPLPRRKG